MLVSCSLTCLTAILIRKELTEPSINTFSLSFLLITTGVNSSSLLVLKVNNKNDFNFVMLRNTYVIVLKESVHNKMHAKCYFKLIFILEIIMHQSQAN